MGNKTTRPSFVFKRRIDAIMYCFRPCEPFDGKNAWKREAIDLWVSKKGDKSYVYDVVYLDAN